MNFDSIKNRQIVQSSNRQIVQSSNRPIVQSSNRPIFSPPLNPLPCQFWNKKTTIFQGGEIYFCDPPTPGFNPGLQILHSSGVRILPTAIR